MYREGERVGDRRLAEGLTISYVKQLLPLLWPHVIKLVTQHELNSYANVFLMLGNKALSSPRKKLLFPEPLRPTTPKQTRNKIKDRRSCQGRALQSQLTDNIMLRTEGLDNSLIPVAPEPLNNHLL